MFANTNMFNLPKSRLSLTATLTLLHGATQFGTR